MKAWIEPLKALGATGLFHAFSAKELADIEHYLGPRKLRLDGHIPILAVQSQLTTAEVMTNPKSSENHSLGTYGFGTAIRCPHLVEQGLKWLDFAAAYLGKEPVMYSVNLMWTFTSGEPMRALNEFHRDRDDTDFFTIFFYLSPVMKAEDGPHEYILGSHRPDGEVNPMMKSFYGPAGTGFLCNTAGLHQGRKPTSSHRLLAWVRYGVSEEPRTYKADRNFPVEYGALHKKLTERERRATRLILSAMDPLYR